MPAQTANRTKRSNQAGAYFGWSAGSAGDVNGDSYADIIAGAKDLNAGKVFVYYGNGRSGAAVALCRIDIYTPPA